MYLERIDTFSLMEIIDRLTVDSCINLTIAYPQLETIIANHPRWVKTLDKLVNDRAAGFAIRLRNRHTFPFFKCTYYNFLITANYTHPHHRLISFTDSNPQSVGLMYMLLELRYLMSYGPSYSCYRIYFLSDRHVATISYHKKTPGLHGTRNQHTCTRCLQRSITPNTLCIHCPALRKNPPPSRPDIRCDLCDKCYPSHTLQTLDAHTQLCLWCEQPLLFNVCISVTHPSVCPGRPIDYLNTCLCTMRAYPAKILRSLEADVQTRLASL